VTLLDLVIYTCADPIALCGTGILSTGA